jgi:hypothetical protein
MVRPEGLGLPQKIEIFITTALIASESSNLNFRIQEFVFNL